MDIFDLKNKYDSENQFEVLINSFEQTISVKNNLTEIKAIETASIKNIVICGLGGSAISGDVFANVFLNELTIPLSVNRNYGLPEFVNEDTLVILSSYSGNTEETLSAAEEALKRKAQIICITTGGKLENFAISNNLFLAKLPKGFQPRYAFYSNFFTLVKVMASLNLIADQNSFIQSAAELLKIKGKEYSEKSSYPASIAEKLIGFIPVIYSVDGVTSGAGLRLKEQFNENSKVHAFHNILPEYNHNEIIGWETFNPDSFNAKVIYIKDAGYHPQIKKRIEITSHLIENKGTEIIALESKEKDFKIRIIDLIYLGDWISYYLALMRGKDPSEIDYIHYLKKQLAKNNM